MQYYNKYIYKILKNDKKQNYINKWTKTYSFLK